MKYLKKYNESKIVTLDSLSNDELEEKLEWLSVEYKEMQEQMVSIRKILTKRKEEKEKDYSNSLPESIFDFNDEQLEWLLEHHHGTTSEHYKIAQKYFNKLKGVFQSGFNENTKQFYFNINSYSCINEAEDGFEYNEEVGKTIKFLGEKLKRHDDYVEFSISYTFEGSGYNDRVLYYSDTDVRYKQGWGSVDMRQGVNKGSVEGVLRSIVEHDLSEKDNVDW